MVCHGFQVSPTQIHWSKRIKGTLLKHIRSQRGKKIKLDIYNDMDWVMLETKGCHII